MIKKIVSGLLILFILTTISAHITQTLAVKKDNNQKTQKEKIATDEYKLPFPGILPDHPLYKIKTLRDKIILFLIRDPYKKAAKHLEFADKMLFSALKLAEKGKISLAAHTAFKGEHQMTLLVGEVKKAFYSNGQIYLKLSARSHKAAKKHQELLDGMADRAKGEDKKPFKTIKEFSLRNDKELFKLEKEATPSQRRVQ